MDLAHAPLLFWFLAGLLTLAAISSAIWPMLKKGADDQEASHESDEATRSVLIDQLEEIERDQGRGLLNESEVGSARAEVARRLIALDREGQTASATHRKSAAMLYPWAAIILIPVITVGIYGISGSPNLPDQPIASRTGSPSENQVANSASNIETMLAQVEERLKTNPEDLRGWMVVAPVYVRQGNLEKAEAAFRQIIALQPAEKQDLGAAQNGLGQVLALKSEGAVSDEALSLFQQAQVNLPGDASGFFFEALGLSQREEQQEQAIAAWENVIARFGSENPSWLPIAEQTLAGLKAPSAAPSQAEAPVLPGPTSEDIEAAHELSDEDRSVMIEGMVAGLAARLEENPNDIQGWRRLVRSYMVLGRKPEASQALEKARLAFSDDEAATSALDAIAKRHGL